MFGVDDAALALIAAGVIGTAGQLYTNRQNLKYQSKVNDVNWQIAAMNNATQVDMANTAHQREVADLRKAGLNPILSAGGSGASTPNLTSLRGDAAQIQNPVNDLASSAKGLARYFGETYQTQLEQAKADVQATKLDNEFNKFSNLLQQRQFELTDLQMENDTIEELLRSDALKTATGIFPRKFHNVKDGTVTRAFDVDDPDALEDAAKDVSDSYLAAWRDGTNVNWRNNLRAIGGAVGDVSGLMNGASSLMRATQALRHSRQRSNRP